MSASYTTRGIILAKQPYSQWAEFYTLYTEDFGKMKVLCRGSKKITSKLASHLQPLTLADICFVRGRRHVQLIGSRKVDGFKGIFADYNKLNHACHVIELVNTLVKYEDPDKAIYRLLEQCLYVLHYAEGEYDVVSKAFGFLLLSLLGFNPEIDTCTMCTTDVLAENNHFSITEGGVICNTCFQKRHQLSTIRVDKSTLHALRDLTELHFEVFEKDMEQYKRLLPIFKQFINHYTERKLKSSALLEYVINT